MGLAKRFLAGSALNLIDQSLRFIAAFVMMPFMIACLTKPVYGFWAMLMAIVGHYSLLDFGLSFSISRFFSKAIGKKDNLELSKLVSTALLILSGIGAVGLLLTAIGYVIIPMFGLDPEKESLARWIVVLYGLFLSIGFPVRVFRSLLKSHLRYDLIVIASLIQITVGTLLIYCFLSLGYGLYALALITVGAGFLEYSIILYATKRIWNKDVQVKRSLVEVSRLREILKYSSVSFVTQMGIDMRSKVDPIIIGSVLGFSKVTLYNVGTRFPMYLTDVIGAVLGGQLLTIFSQSQGKTGSADESTKQFLMATRLSAVIALFCGSSLIFYGYQFLERWMVDELGDEFVISYHILAILMVPYIFSLMQYPSWSYIYSLAKHKILAIITIVGGAANLTASLILVHKIGIYGAVWATCGEMSIVYLIVIPIVVCKVGKVGFIDYYLKTLAHPLLLSLLILAPYFYIVHRFIEPDYIRLFILGLFQVIYFAPLAFFLVLTKEERSILYAALPFKR